MTSLSNEEDWLDETLLNDDTSKRMWKNKSVGTTTTKAMAAIRPNTRIQLVVAIDRWRAYKQWCDSKNLSPMKYARQTLGQRLANEADFPQEHLAGFQYEPET